MHVKKTACSKHFTLIQTNIVLDPEMDSEKLTQMKVNKNFESNKM